VSVRFNHTIVFAEDKHQSAQFLADIFDLDQPEDTGAFVAVRLADDVVLDYAERDHPVTTQHYALLVSEQEFDGVLAQVRDRGITYWADPRRTRPGQINDERGGRGMYFEDPSGHLLEALTRP